MTNQERVFSILPNRIYYLSQLLSTQNLNPSRSWISRKPHFKSRTDRSRNENDRENISPKEQKKHNSNNNKEKDRKRKQMLTKITTTITFLKTFQTMKRWTTVKASQRRNQRKNKEFNGSRRHFHNALRNPVKKNPEIPLLSHNCSDIFNQRKQIFWSWIGGKTNCGMWVWEISEFGGRAWNGSEGERETFVWSERKIRKIGEGGEYLVWKRERAGEGLLYTYRERESFGQWPLGVSTRRVAVCQTKSGTYTFLPWLVALLLRTQQHTVGFQKTKKKNNILSQYFCYG